MSDPKSLLANNLETEVHPSSRIKEWINVDHFRSRTGQIMRFFTGLVEYLSKASPGPSNGTGTTPHKVSLLALKAIGPNIEHISDQTWAANMSVSRVNVLRG